MASSSTQGYGPRFIRRAPNAQAAYKHRERAEGERLFGAIRNLAVGLGQKADDEKELLEKQKQAALKIQRQSDLSSSYRSFTDFHANSFSNYLGVKDGSKVEAAFQKYRTDIQDSISRHSSGISDPESKKKFKEKADGYVIQHQDRVYTHLRNSKVKGIEDDLGYQLENTLDSIFQTGFGSADLSRDLVYGTGLIVEVSKSLDWNVDETQNAVKKFTSAALVQAVKSMQINKPNKVLGFINQYRSSFTYYDYPQVEKIGEQVSKDLVDRKKAQQADFDQQTYARFAAMISEHPEGIGAGIEQFKKVAKEMDIGVEIQGKVFDYVKDLVSFKKVESDLAEKTNVDILTTYMLGVYSSDQSKNFYRNSLELFTKSSLGKEYFEISEEKRKAVDSLFDLLKERRYAKEGSKSKRTKVQESSFQHKFMYSMFHYVAGTERFPTPEGTYKPLSALDIAMNSSEGSRDNNLKLYLERNNPNRAKISHGFSVEKIAKLVSYLAPSDVLDESQNYIIALQVSDQIYENMFKGDRAPTESELPDLIRKYTTVRDLGSHGFFDDWFGSSSKNILQFQVPYAGIELTGEIVRNYLDSEDFDYQELTDKQVRDILPYVVKGAQQFVYESAPRVLQTEADITHEMITNLDKSTLDNRPEDYFDILRKLFPKKKKQK